MLGLHSNWWAILTELAQVCTDLREGGQGDARVAVAGINQEVWCTT
jgi:hypothetical protein